MFLFSSLFPLHIFNAVIVCAKYVSESLELDEHREGTAVRCSIEFKDPQKERENAFKQVKINRARLRSHRRYFSTLNK
jgi:hypothetical protein